MLYNILSELKLIQFNVFHVIKYKIFPTASKKNKFIAFVSYVLSVLLLLISLIPMAIVIAIYLSIYLVVGILIALLAVSIFGLFGEINKELVGFIISIVVASIGLLGALIKYLIASKKSFSENKRIVYIGLFNFLYKQIKKFKQGKKMEELENLSEVTMFSSNIVLRYLNRIKSKSNNLEGEIDKLQIIDTTIFLIDFMRNEIKSRGNGFTFYDYSFTDLKLLCDGDFDENGEKSDNLEKTLGNSQIAKEQEMIVLENKPKKRNSTKKVKETPNETKI